VIAGHDEVQRVDKVRRVAQQQATLVQRLAHESDVALLQVAEAAVDELRASAGSPLGEIALLHQRCLQPARRCVHRHAQAGRAAADDEHVPERRLLQQGADGVSAVHTGKLRALVRLASAAEIGIESRRTASSMHPPFR